MVVNKRFICLCEDVTVDEVRNAIRRGYTDIGPRTFRLPK
jgi:bacterioferritin-associated ferredoxin